MPFFQTSVGLVALIDTFSHIFWLFEVIVSVVLFANMSCKVLNTYVQDQSI